MFYVGHQDNATYLSEWPQHQSSSQIFQANQSQSMAMDLDHMQQENRANDV